MEQKERKKGQKKRKGIYTKTHIQRWRKRKQKMRKGSGRQKKGGGIRTHIQKDKKRKQGRVEGRWEGELKCSRTPRFSDVLFGSYPIGFT